MDAVHTRGILSYLELLFESGFLVCFLIGFHNFSLKPQRWGEERNRVAAVVFH